MLILLNENTIYNSNTGRTISYDPEGDGRAVLLLDGTTSDGQPIVMYNGEAAQAWGRLVDVAAWQSGGMEALPDGMELGR